MTNTLAAWPNPRRKLVAQGVQALAGEDVAALHYDGPATGGFAAVIETEDRAGIDPMPAFGFGPATPQRGGFVPKHRVRGCSKRPVE